MNVDGVLPIGSVVVCPAYDIADGNKENSEELMIIGYGHKVMLNGNEYVFHYCGCPYPEGMNSTGNLRYFDHQDITTVRALGFSNADVEKILKEVDEQFPKLRHG